MRSEVASLQPAALTIKHYFLTSRTKASDDNSKIVSSGMSGRLIRKRAPPFEFLSGLRLVVRDLP
jgi:hypothetical protein